MTYAEELLEYLEKMDIEQQEQLLAFVRHLNQTPDAMSDFMQVPRLFDPQSADVMEATILKMFEGIDWNLWR